MNSFYTLLNVNFNDYQGFESPLCFPQILKFRQHAGKPWAAGFDIELLKDFYFLPRSSLLLCFMAIYERYD